jgi:LysM domain
MTVAPELPPVLARRRGSRRLRVVVDRTPAGVVALVEPARPCGPPAPVPSSVVVPAPPVEPGIGREHRPADPASRRSSRLAATDGRQPGPADPAPRRSSRLAATDGRQPGPADPASRGSVGSRAVLPGREHRLANPASRGPVGSRAVLLGWEHRLANPASHGPGGSRDVLAGRRSAPGQAGVHTRPAAALTADDLTHARPAGAARVRLPSERTRPVVPRPVGARVVRPAPGHLRLTRRGRLVTAAATVLIAALTLVGVVSRAGSLRETAPVPASAPAQVVVAPGETLWSIAVRIAPDRDPRPVVAGIQRLNDLPTPDVHAGQTLLLRTP